MKSFFIKSILLLTTVITVTCCTSDSKIEEPLIYPNPYKVLEDINTINNNFSIKMLNRTTAISVGELGTVIKTVDQGITWQKLDAQTNSNINDLSFTSQHIGWIVGDLGVIKKTTNQGENWIDKTPATGVLSASENILAVNFFNDNLGVCTTNLGKILITKDGGTTWIAKVAKTIDNKDILTALRSVYIKDATTFYIVGSGGILLKTTNFGDSFTLIPTTATTNIPTGTTGNSANNPILYRIRPSSINQAYICGSSGIVMKLNFINDALSLVNPPVNEPMMGVSFLSDNLGYVVGRFGLIFKTENGGVSWSRLKSGVSTTLTDVAYWNDKLGYVAGSKAVLKTKQE